MNFVVVGSRGYVGRNLVDYLKTEGYGCWRLDRLSTNSGVELVNTLNPRERFSAETLGDLVSSARTLHLQHYLVVAGSTNKNSGATDAGELVSANVSFPVQTAAMALESGAKSVTFASSFSVEVHQGEYSPQTLYAATKRSAEVALEFFAQTHGLNINILRLYDIYGLSQPHARLIPALVKAALTQRKLRLSPGEQKMAPIWVSDVCSAMLQATSDSIGFQIFDVPGPEVFTVRQIAGKVAEVAGVRLNELAEFTGEYRAREIMELNAGLFRTIPGWTPLVNLESGLGRLMMDGASSEG